MSMEFAIKNEIEARISDSAAYTAKLPGAATDYRTFNLGYNWASHLSPSISLDTPMSDVINKVIESAIEAGDTPNPSDELALGAVVAAYADRRSRQV